MPWFKVDDELHEHRKARKAGKAAMGVWVLAGSWAADNGTGGFVPEDVVRRWGTSADAKRLVDAGLWKVETLHDEDGWRFHDWNHFQPSAAVTEAGKVKRSESGKIGNHRRWHVKRNITDPDCEFCHPLPDREPDRDPHPDDVAHAIAPAIANPIGSVSQIHPPYPVPVPNSDATTSPHVSEAAPPAVRRGDVERICDHLADRIEANGSKRPTITKGWRDAARLMLDRDKRTEDDVHGAIDWCQDSDFWRGNVLSLPKLREKYDQLRLQAQRQQRPTSRAQADGDMFERAMERAVAREAGQ